MGCGCGKSKPPAGMTTRVGTESTTTGTETTKQGLTQSFRLTMPDGSQEFYGSRLEAEAQRVRSGGVGTIATF